MASMEITGSDTVIVAPAPRAAVTRFLRHWSERWPRMLVKAGSGAEPFAEWGAGSVALPARLGELLVARDEGMLEWWDENGYALDRRGEGPLAFYYRPLARRTIRMRAEQDPYRWTADEEFEPYEVILAPRALSLITVVTPPPEDGPFAGQVIDALVDGVGARRRGPRRSEDRGEDACGSGLVAQPDRPERRHP
jgi:hypothetical protein